MLSQKGGKSEVHYTIERACDGFRSKPDQALNYEIADMINKKKANTPREAAVTVVRLINDRDPTTSQLALQLLDVLVKNCGYPFHLQIATKDFLNELVRRFPEKPPIHYPPWMAGIVKLIHEWKNTICATSKHKEDLVHIRDMHRLLTYKGYRFPRLDQSSAAVLNPSESLKTPEELEEEDRAAQSAKLQELIRRGTPKDLAAAQELMKIMAGANPDKQPDYAAQTQKELDRVQQRALLLNEMLNAAGPNERFADGDTYDQLAQHCRQVQPKLQKWITEAEEQNPEALDRLLMINDLLNQILNRYTAFKRGDFTATVEINPGIAGKDAGKGSKPAAQVNLIDFDDPEPAATTPSATTDMLSGFDGLSLGGGGSSGAPTASGSSFYQSPSVPASSFPTSAPQTAASNQTYFNMLSGLQPTQISLASSFSSPSVSSPAAPPQNAPVIWPSSSSPSPSNMNAGMGMGGGFGGMNGNGVGAIALAGSRPGSTAPYSSPSPQPHLQQFQQRPTPSYTPAQPPAFSQTTPAQPTQQQQQAQAAKPDPFADLDKLF